MPDPSPKLDTVHFISTLTGQSSQLSVLSFSPSSDCASQSDQSVHDTVSATPPSTLIPLLQQVTAVVGAELIVVMVTAIVVLLGSVAVCCSLWRHGNSGSTNQGGFSYHMSSASSTPSTTPTFSGIITHYHTSRIITKTTTSAVRQCIYTNKQFTTLQSEQLANDLVNCYLVFNYQLP